MIQSNQINRYDRAISSDKAISTLRIIEGHTTDASKEILSLDMRFSKLQEVSLVVKPKLIVMSDDVFTVGVFWDGDIFFIINGVESDTKASRMLFDEILKHLHN